jgi:hypothetical protein
VAAADRRLHALAPVRRVDVDVDVERRLLARLERDARAQRAAPVGDRAGTRDGGRPLAGVEAGRAGAFGWVVGVDRAGQAEELRRRGADVVVGDLSELLERR